jgi:Rieske Fe-S protein
MTMDRNPSLSAECSACNDCPAEGAQSRRAFLRNGFAAAFTALAAVGFVGKADAMPVRWTQALARTGGTLSYNVPASDGAEIDRNNEVILVRWQNAVYAFNLSCPHQHTALRWEEAAQQFQCPKHHSHYRPDGTFISGRATRGMDRFPLSRQGGSLVVDVAQMYRQDQDPAAWNAAVIHL